MDEADAMSSAPAASYGLFTGDASVVIDEPVILDTAPTDSGYWNGWNRTDVPLTYPSTLSLSRQAVHFACIGIGFPLNALVACVIFRQRRLRNPRNTFWLGTIVCNLVALTNAIVEYAAFVSQDPLACFLFSSSAGMPYTVYLTKKSEVIKRRVSLKSRWACYWQLN